MMMITLGSFVIVNGDDRTLQVDSEETIELTQETQVASPMRSSWKVAFPDRAVSSMPLSYVVTFPPCPTLSLAFFQSRQIIAQCPNGGTLVEYLDGEITTYSQVWRKSVSCERMGLTNQFTFDFEAVNPAFTSYLADTDGTVLQDESGTDLGN